MRRRASGDRALKGPTPHAPSSCQLSFLPPFALFSSLLFPLLPSLPLLPLSLSLDFFFGLSLSALTTRTSFSRFSSAFLCTSALSPVTFDPSPPALLLRRFLAAVHLSWRITRLPRAFSRRFRRFLRPIFLPSPFPAVSSSHDSPPPPSPPSRTFFSPIGLLVSSRSALAFWTTAASIAFQVNAAACTREGERARERERDKWRKKERPRTRW